MSVAPTLQNLRIGLKRRQSGKSKVLAKAAWKLDKNATVSDTSPVQVSNSVDDGSGRPHET